MPLYVVSPADAAHPAAREIFATSPAEAADKACSLGIPCSPDYSYFVHSTDGDCTEVETEDPELETILSLGQPDPVPGCPDFLAEAFPV